MGEKDDRKKSDGEKVTAVAADGGGKKEEGPITVVLKLDLHCEGCAKKVRRSVNHFEGVEKVKADWGANKLTVTGNVDPSWLRERVEIKTKKKVELISPQPKNGGGDKKSDEKPAEKKAEEKKAEDKKPKEPVVSTVVMKIKLHCDGCANKVKRTILKHIDGVNSVKTDVGKDLVTVIGTMEPKEVPTYLQEKLKRPVEVLPPPKKDDGPAADKKGKEGGGGGDKKDKAESSGGDKKEKESGGGGEKKESGGDKKDTGPKDGDAVHGGEEKKGEEKKVEVNKMEFQGYNPQTLYAMSPMYNQNYAYNQDHYGSQMYHHQSYPNTGHMVQYTNGPNQDHFGAQMYRHQGYPNTGHMVQYTNGPPPPPPTYVNDQYFSDENPNGCSVM